MKNEFCYIVLVFLLMNTTVVFADTSPGEVRNPVSLDYKVEGESEPIYTEVLEWDHTLFTVDMCLGPDGSIYSLCRYNNDTGETTQPQMNIVKWNNKAEVQWVITWKKNGSVYANDILATRDGVYVTGNYYENDISHLFLVRFNDMGGAIWERTWTFGDRNDGWSLASTSGGSVFVGAYIRWTDRFDPEWNGSAIILKYNPRGDLLWTATIHEPLSYYAFPDILVSHDDRICASFHNLTEFNSDGSVKEIITPKNSSFRYSQVTPSGDFVSVYSGGLYTVRWINTSGYDTWYYDPPRIWNEFLSSFAPFDAAPDNSVYVLCGLVINETKLVLTKFNSTGAMLWNQSLVYEHDIWSGCVGGIEVSSDGTIFIASIYLEDEIAGTALSIYRIGNFTPYWQTTSSTTTDTTSLDPSYGVAMFVLLGGIGAAAIVLLLVQQGIRRGISLSWKK
ncbi:MAG: hypothetical protein RTU30_16335 [Candidatus Thorarchaeota archaeon]